MLKSKLSESKAANESNYPPEQKRETQHFIS